MYFIRQGFVTLPSLSLLPPFQNMFLALLLYNQRPIKVLFPKTKKQFLLEDEIRPHFQGCFPSFYYQGFQKHGIEFLLIEHFTQGQNAISRMVVMGIGIRRNLEIRQLLQLPCQAFQGEQCNQTSKTLELEGTSRIENWLISSLPQQIELMESQLNAQPFSESVSYLVPHC